MALEAMARGWATLREEHPWLLYDDAPREGMFGEATHAISGTEPGSNLRFRVSVTIEDLGRTLTWRLWTAAGRWFKEAPEAVEGMVVLATTTDAGAEGIRQELELAIPDDEIVDTWLHVSDVLGPRVQLERVRTRNKRWHCCFEYGEARYMVSAWLLDEMDVGAAKLDIINNRGIKFDRDWLSRTPEYRAERADAVARSPVYQFGLCPEGPRILEPVQSPTAVKTLLDCLRRFTVQFVRMNEEHVEVRALDKGKEQDLDYVQRTVRRACDVDGHFDRPLWGKVPSPPSSPEECEPTPMDTTTGHMPGAFKRTRDGDIIMPDASVDEEEEAGDFMVI
jgi:hypothetical protein